jgi:hypothetical protein
VIKNSMRVPVAVMCCVVLAIGSENAPAEKRSDDPKPHSRAHAEIVRHATVARTPKVVSSRSHEVAKTRTNETAHDAGRQMHQVDRDVAAGRNARAGRPPVKVASAPPVAAVPTPRPANRRTQTVAAVGGPARAHNGVIDGSHVSKRR